MGVTYSRLLPTASYIPVTLDPYHLTLHALCYVGILHRPVSTSTWCTMGQSQCSVPVIPMIYWQQAGSSTPPHLISSIGSQEKSPLKARRASTCVSISHGAWPTRHFSALHYIHQSRLHGIKALQCCCKTFFQPIISFSRITACATLWSSVDDIDIILRSHWQPKKVGYISISNTQCKSFW